jgi:hypothetical protein
VISEEDLIFVLDYMKEEYTQEEVREMISMLSGGERKQVTLEDFKKLGRGELVPLAKFKPPDVNGPEKEKIMQNVAQTALINEDPEFLIKCLKRESVSYPRFEENKKDSKRDLSACINRVPVEEKLMAVTPLLSLPQLRERREVFVAFVLSNLSDLVHNYSQFRDKPISIQKVAAML